MNNNLIEKLYNIEDTTETVPQKVLGYINENFKILEMSSKQGTANSITITDLAETIFESMLTRGLEADMPVLTERNGHLLYWATDTHKLYALWKNT